MLKSLLTSFSQYKFLILSALAVLIVVSFSLLWLQNKVLKAEAEVSKFTISAQVETIKELEESSKKIVAINKKLRQTEALLLKQKQKNTVELKDSINKSGYTYVFRKKLECLELATGANPSEYQPNEFCPRHSTETKGK